ncbi:MAG: hypothetical protein R3Y57_05165 [Erysipelotrichaceae bacterium]
MKRLIIFLCVITLCMLNLNITVYAQDDLELYSNYYLLIDRDNGQVIFEDGSDEKIYPASMTKIMTLLIAVEEIKDMSETVVLDSVIFENLYEENASMAGYYLDEVVSLQDCVYGLFLPSGAETTRAVATYVAGSEDAFVELMNQKAEELGMSNTHFVNTTGLHDADHYTTLNDLAVLLEYSLQNKAFQEIFYTREYVSTSGSYHSSGLSWESTMFSAIDNIGWQDLDESAILGGKTGYTNPAGLCLASVASLDGRNYMLITALAPVTGTSYHAIDAVNTYSEIYTEYVKEEWFNPEQSLGEIELNYKWFQDTIAYYPQEVIALTLPNDVSSDEIQIISDVPETIDAPIELNQVLGSVQVIYEEEVIYQFNVVSNEQIERSNVLYYTDVIMTWIMNHLVISIVSFSIIIAVLWLAYIKWIREKRLGYRRLY